MTAERNVKRENVAKDGCLATTGFAIIDERMKAKTKQCNNNNNNNNNITNNNGSSSGNSNNNLPYNSSSL